MILKVIFVLNESVNLLENLLKKGVTFGHET